MKGPWRKLAIAAAVLALGVGAFFGANKLATGQQAPSPTPTLTPWRGPLKTPLFEPPRETPFEGVLNGIRFTRQTPLPGLYKCQGPVSRFNDLRAEETPLAGVPRYLPLGARAPQGGEVNVCDGKLISVRYVLPVQMERAYPLLQIGRLLASEPTLPAVCPRERLTTGTIRGQPAVFCDRPGGLSQVYIAEPFGITHIITSLPLEEARKIAESLK